MQVPVALLQYDDGQQVSIGFPGQVLPLPEMHTPPLQVASPQLV